MSQTAARIANQFLSKINSNNGKEIFETIETLLEILETKDDPEMTEVFLVNNISEFIEKFQVLRSNLKSYSKGNRTLFGDKLSSLYNNED